MTLDNLFYVMLDFLLNSEIINNNEGAVALATSQKKPACIRAR
jgi:hypothetical protein